MRERGKEGRREGEREGGKEGGREGRGGREGGFSGLGTVLGQGGIESDSLFPHPGYGVYWELWEGKSRRVCVGLSKAGGVAGTPWILGKRLPG